MSTILRWYLLPIANFYYLRLIYERRNSDYIASDADPTNTDALYRLFRSEYRQKIISSRRICLNDKSFTQIQKYWKFKRENKHILNIRFKHILT